MSTDDVKPVRYNLLICYGTFDGDTAGFESSTPFIPLSVGDYLDQNGGTLNAGGAPLKEGQSYRVTAVKHGFQDLKSHISQYVYVCVEAVGVPGATVVKGEGVWLQPGTYTKEQLDQIM